MAAEYDPRVTPWQVDEEDFQSLDTFESRARFLVRYAILAPSGHNTQPWKFEIGDDRVLCYKDNSRRLPTTDPEDRELLMSIGAAIFNLVVAAQHFGFGTEVVYEDERERPGLVASVVLEEWGDSDPAIRRLFSEIPKRHTNRGVYEPGDIPDFEIQRFKELNLGDNSGIAVVTESRLRENIAGLAAEGDRTRMSDSDFRTELADWMRPAGTDAGDGMPGDLLGIPGFASRFAPWLMRHFNMGNSTARSDSALVAEAPVLVVIHSDDRVESLLESGQLFEYFALTATMLGLQYSLFNLPVEVPDIREKLRSLLELEDPPQLLIRAGNGEPMRDFSPRREPESVLLT